MNTGISTIVTILSLLFTCSALSKATDQPTPLWTGVEIVTNDRNVHNKASKIIDISPGEYISWSDLRLPRNCAKIRNALQDRAVRCGSVLSDGNRSLYVVEITTKINNPRRIIECEIEARLPAILTVLAERHMEKLGKNLGDSTDATGEYINENGQLDNFGVNSHELDLQTSIEVRGKFAQLKLATRSCSSKDRSNSILLMNFSGLPKHSLDAALSLLDDPDENVRNNSSRLVGSFLSYLPTARYGFLMNHACKKISQESFLERNKGLGLVLGVLKLDRNGSKLIPTPCNEKISELAAESTSAQIGDMARLIQKLVVTRIGDRTWMSRSM